MLKKYRLSGAQAVAMVRASERSPRFTYLPHTTMNTTTTKTRSKEWLRKRMEQEAKSFAHYAGGNPMRSIIGKRYENARKRWLSAS